MAYVDADFLLALLKKNDWLNERAMALKTRHSGKLTTSIAALLEVLLVGRRHGIPAGELVEGTFKILHVRDIAFEDAMQAAHYIDEEHLSIFDAFHAVLSGDEPIISSDRVYDRIGKKRIPLEPSPEKSGFGIFPKGASFKRDPDREL